MKNDRKLTDEELEKLKQLKETNKELQDAILFETEALRPKEAKKRNEQKEKEIRHLLSGEPFSVYSKKQFNKMLLKNPTFRDITFIQDYYDALYRITGLKKSKEHPNQKPEIFAVLTIKFIYRRFNVRNLMLELWERNPFLTGESFREFKHYQLLNDDNYLNLLSFINDFIKFAEGYERKLYKFDIDYCKHFRLTTDMDMFYKGE